MKPIRTDVCRRLVDGPGRGRWGCSNCVWSGNRSDKENWERRFLRLDIAARDVSDPSDGSICRWEWHCGWNRYWAAMAEADWRSFCPVHAAANKICSTERFSIHDSESDNETGKNFKDSKLRCKRVFRRCLGRNDEKSCRRLIVLCKKKHIRTYCIFTHRMARQSVHRCYLVR